MNLPTKIIDARADIKKKYHSNEMSDCYLNNTFFMTAEQLYAFLRAEYVKTEKAIEGRQKLIENGKNNGGGTRFIHQGLQTKK